MLYLPPRLAHNGVALSECMTWSVGFRAPSHQEIASAFLDYLQERLKIEGRYADPDLQVPRHPAALPAAMIERLGAVIDGIHWSRRDIVDFLGRYLSEPKPSVFFEPPRRPMRLERFAERIDRGGLHLDPRTRLLFHGSAFYVNGERLVLPPAQRRLMVELADRRALPPMSLPDELLAALYDMYRAGYLWPGACPPAAS